MLSKENITYEVEQNLIDLYIKAAEISDGKIEDTGKYSFARNQYMDSYCKVFKIKIPDTSVEKEIEFLISNIEKGLAPKNLLLGSSTRPLDFEKYLPRFNFVKVYEQTGMAVIMDETRDYGALRGDDIKCICSDSELAEWLQTADNAFGKERNPQLYGMLSKDEEVKCLGLYFNGRLVTTAMLLIKGEVAGIHLVGTLKDCRGRGFCTEIIRKALLMAKEFGCKLAVLQASEMGRKIYLNIGFKEYGKVSHWEYKK